MTAKKITQSSIIGAQGVALVAQRVFEMGLVWHPTDANVEAGIDGIIELRDSSTGTMLNSILQVQSRATSRNWAGETETGFDYLCDPEELSYWMAGNAPVLLICSRPDAGEVYWISVKDYFSTPARRLTRRVHFDKTAHRFDASAREALMHLGVSRDAGVYLSPPPIAESLLLNLVPLSFSDTIWIGDTTARGPGDVWRALIDRSDREWVLHAKRLVSFHDLTQSPWRSLCDQGTVESFPADEWRSSRDPDRNQQLVRLLNECVRAKLARLSMRYFERGRDDHYHYFLPLLNEKPREVHYRSLSISTSRTVVGRYQGRRDGSTFFRHNAVSIQLRQLSGDWFIAITPTYHFTHDGERAIRRYGGLLSGIKRLERHGAVLGQVVMWAALLLDPSQEGELFPVEPYRFLSTGPLVTVHAPAGVNDQAWVSTDDDPPEEEELPLFRTGEEARR